MRLRKPSPAMVIACIALFVALGGVGYAAFNLPADSVRSRHIVNGQVKRVDLAPGLLPAGRFNAGGEAGGAVCNPDVLGISDETCAFIKMNLPRPARVLLVVSGSWHEQGTLDGSVLGRCALYADSPALWSASYGQKTQTFVPNGGGMPYNGTVSETFVSDVLPAGKHDFRVDCSENEADITYVIGLSAVRLSAS